MRERSVRVSGQQRKGKGKGKGKEGEGEGEGEVRKLYAELFFA